MAALAILVAPRAQAHDLWATAENPTAGQPVVSILGYGHDFPEGEEIAADRLSIFYPLEVTNAQGQKLALKPGDKNYIFVTEEPVKEGTYLLTTGYKPTFWSYSPEGSFMKSKKDTPNATSCEQWTRWAKGVVNVGNASDDFVTKPIGNSLEFVPSTNPAKIKVGEDLTIQLLRDGKPLPKTEITGILAGNKHHEDGNRDFYATTNGEGKITFSPIKEGLWTLIAIAHKDFADKAVCDDDAVDASLTFTVK
jgi:uncharacterized GH25 family protein